MPGDLLPEDVDVIGHHKDDCAVADVRRESEVSGAEWASELPNYETRKYAAKLGHTWPPFATTIDYAQARHAPRLMRSGITGDTWNG